MAQPPVMSMSNKVPLLRAIRRYYAPSMFLALAFFGFSETIEHIAKEGPFKSSHDKVIIYLNESEKKAFEAFATARLINASVSVLKATDLSFSIGVAGVKVDLLEVLQPIDDLAKQFSDVMLISVISIFVQKLILLISQTWALNLLLPIGCLFLGGSLMLSRDLSAKVRLSKVGRGFIIFALFARFAIPLVAVVGGNITDTFLSKELDVHLSDLKVAGDNLANVRPKITPEVSSSSREPTPAINEKDGTGAQSMFGQMRSAVSATVNATQSIVDKGASLIRGVKDHIPDMVAVEKIVTGIPENIIKSIGRFFVQTILMPIIITFLLYVFLRNVFSRL